MESVIYNSRTKQFSTDDLSTKVVKTIQYGRPVENYQGWSRALIYTAEELKVLGKPGDYAVPMFIKLNDGSIERIASGFRQRALEKDRQAERQTPWFGKVIPLEGKDGSKFRILDLETGKIVEEKETVGDIYLFDKDYYEIYSQDWSSFDVIGAFDESASYLKRNGITVIQSSRPMKPIYEDGNFIGVSCSGKFVSKEDLDGLYQKRLATANLRKALALAKEAGLKPEDIQKEVNRITKTNTNDFVQ
ncbi:MAG: hypothetical protein J6Q51_03730 [Clostridia bacterium]|nr:hypothetical protein [Clostridia bacterium]